MQKRNIIKDIPAWFYAGVIVGIVVTIGIEFIVILIHIY